ncbi:MAG: Undecaprenyl-phosphate glucose phosphotransferase [Candidatus Berkelbacteria bacterium Gr01-1014_85]|uniref:Undecaprenyl-phosphate glucose phosphotransferase n=1 Tax=Candidatus Berkelbacteria bacterium Gr01-1014_85 TaxID=2017150 RepID=A0A554JBZ0_9BACT|nr:MAG: Undecaprenyl-phosphate glucose phosphotransferase [Candidatus Berkelbacteria bacterium Gr01-1014_85]
MQNKRFELLFTLISIPLDLVAVFLAYLLAYLFRSEADILQVVYLWPLDDYLGFVGLMLPFYSLIFASTGLYSLRDSHRRRGEFTKVFLASSAGIMLFLLWVFLTRTLFFSRLVVIYAWIFSIITVWLTRAILAWTQRYLYRFGYGLKRIVIIGESPTATELHRVLSADISLGYKVVNGLIKPELAQIREILDRDTVDEILLADTGLSNRLEVELHDLSHQYQVAFRMVPSLAMIRSTNIEIQTLAAIPVIEYRQTRLVGWGVFFKRLFDIVASALAVIVLAPFYLLIALLVKLDSAGPIFYRHRRLGYQRQEIDILKFRTLKTEYCTGADYGGKTNEQTFSEQLKRPDLYQEFAREQKLKTDPRATRLGSFLRKTSLDELPQFINVLKGDLSLVGPRPITAEEVARYGQDQHRLFCVKPGLTGLWQVSGRSDMPYEERVKLDMLYIENWSFWSDIIIAAKTFVVMVARKNAY